MLKSVLTNIICDSSEGPEGTKFGLVLENSKIKFLMPAAFKKIKEERPAFDLLKDGIQILLKYEKDTKKMEAGTVLSYNDSLSKLSVIYAYIELINDYETYGIYRAFKKSQSHGFSNISWKKTLKQLPTLTHNSEIIYPLFSTNVNRTDNENEFYKLYLETLNVAFMLVGGKIFDTIIKGNSSKGDFQKKSVIIKKINNSFKSRDLKIANLLKNIYCESPFQLFSPEKNRLEFVVKFEHIWQAMIKEGLSNSGHGSLSSPTFKQGSYIIDPTYKQINGPALDNIDTSGLQQRPDYIFEPNASAVMPLPLILDAKFYPENKLPRSSDIGKQLLYQRFFGKPCGSFFLLPFFDSKKSTKTHELRYTHTIASSALENIYCVYLNFDYVKNAYLKNRKLIEFIQTLEIWPDYTIFEEHNTVDQSCAKTLENSIVVHPDSVENQGFYIIEHFLKKYIQNTSAYNLFIHQYSKIGFDIDCHPSKTAKKICTGGGVFYMPKNLQNVGQVNKLCFDIIWILKSLNFFKDIRYLDLITPVKNNAVLSTGANPVTQSTGLRKAKGLPNYRIKRSPWSGVSSTIMSPPYPISDYFEEIVVHILNEFLVKFPGQALKILGALSNMPGSPSIRAGVNEHNWPPHATIRNITALLKPLPGGHVVELNIHSNTKYKDSYLDRIVTRLSVLTGATAVTLSSFVD